MEKWKNNEEKLLKEYGLSEDEIQGFMIMTGNSSTKKEDIEKDR